VLEAASQAGGQISLLVKNPRRRELVGIVDWRLAELERLGVQVQYVTFAEPEDVTALAPEVVIIATGGLPQNPPLDGGDELATSSWDVLSGAVRPGAEVLVYDDGGGHAGMSAAEVLARGGARVELVSPERFFAPDIGGLNHAPYMATFHEAGVRVTINTRLQALERAGNRVRAILGSDFAPAWREAREVDQVVVEHGTAPNDALYVALKPRSINLGRVDYAALIRPEGDILPEINPDGAFLLYRIGDAVAARNIHAGVYDALRMGLRW
jgi:N-methyl-L-proline demethylase